MFEATLKNCAYPEARGVKVAFPIPEDRYDETIYDLDDIHIGGTAPRDCLVGNVSAPDCPALVRLTGTMANIDELDWLGKQLESFDRYELLQFCAAAERFDISSVDKLMNLSFCSREVTVVSDFNDLERIGKRHYLTLRGSCASEKLEKVDGKETALRLITGQTGCVTQYGVIYDNGMKLEKVYDQRHLPPTWMAEDCLLELEIGAPGETDPQKHEWPQLPTSLLKLERAMLRAGVDACGEMQIILSDSRLPDEVTCALDIEQESLLELNRMCQACSDFNEQDFIKLGAVCQLAKPTCAANIRQLAENLDQFDFAPNAHDPEELGKYMIQRSGHHEYDENLESFYNYKAYGEEQLLREDGIFSDKGYVSYHGEMGLDELMRDDSVESYQQEQKANMEGMAW